MKTKLFFLLVCTNIFAEYITFTEKYETAKIQSFIFSVDGQKFAVQNEFNQDLKIFDLNNNKPDDNTYLYVANENSTCIQRISLATYDYAPPVQTKIDTQLTNIDYEKLASLPSEKFKEIIEIYLKKFNAEKNKFDLSDVELYKLNILVDNYLELFLDSKLYDKYKKEIQFLLNKKNINPIFKSKYQNPNIYVNTPHHIAPISVVKINNDGKEIITASWDKTIRIWDFGTGKLKRTIHAPFGKGPEGMIYAMDISKDNKYIAIGGYSVGALKPGLYSGDFITLIDYNTGEILDVQSAHTQAIFSVAFSDDNKYIVSGGGTSDGHIAVHYLFNNKIKFFRRIDLQSGMVRSLKFIPNSNKIVAATENGLLFQIQPEILDSNENSLSPSSIAMIGASPGKMMNLQIANSLNGVVVTNDANSVITISRKPQFHYLKKDKLSLLGNDLKPYKYLGGNLKNDARSLAISPDNKFLATCSDNIILLYNLSDTTINNYVELEHNGRVLTLCFSPDSKYLISAGAEPYDIIIWDVNTKNIYKKISSLYNIALSNVGIAKDNPNLIVWDKIQFGEKISFAFDIKKFQLISNYQGERVISYKNIDFKVPQDISSGSPKIYSKIDDYYIVGYNYAVRAIDNKGKIDVEYSNYGIPANAILSFFNGKILAVAYENGTIDFYRNDAGILLGTLIITKDNQYLFIHSSGYYTGSAAALKDIGWKVNVWDYFKLVEIWKEDIKKNPNATYERKFSFIKNEVYQNKFVKFYPFEQFDLILNRPDLVRQTFFSLDTNEYKYLHLAYKKRINKTNFNPDNFDISKLPMLKIINPINNTNNPSLNLKFSSDKTISSYQIWVNGVPEFKNDWKQNKNNNTIIEETVILNNYDNNIQIAVKDSLNNESIRESFNIFYNPDIKPTEQINKTAEKKSKTKQTTQQKETQEVQPKIYLITIGVSDFNNSDYNLSFPVKDANDISNLFTTLYPQNIEKLSLLNSNFNYNNLQKVKTLLQKSNPNDIVIIFVATHGLLDVANYDYYLATSQTNFDNIKEGSVKFTDIENLLKNIKSRNKLLFIDACHSGEIDKDIIDNISNSQFVTNLKSRGLKILQKERKSVRIDYLKLNQLLNEVFVDIRNQDGSVVISSSAAQEFSYESENIANGIFTYSLIKAIKEKKADYDNNNKISIEELKNFIITNVPKLTNGYQNPSIRADNNYIKLEF